MGEWGARGSATVGMIECLSFSGATADRSRALEIVFKVVVLLFQNVYIKGRMLGAIGRELKRLGEFWTTEQDARRAVSTMFNNRRRGNSGKITFYEPEAIDNVAVQLLIQRHRPRLG